MLIVAFEITPGKNPIISSRSEVHADLIISISPITRLLAWRGKKPNPGQSPLERRGVVINRHTDLSGSRISSGESITLTYIVLLFTWDGVAADFSVLYRCQVPKKKQGHIMVTLVQTNWGGGWGVPTPPSQEEEVKKKPTFSQWAASHPARRGGLSCCPEWEPEQNKSMSSEDTRGGVRGKRCAINTISVKRLTTYTYWDLDFLDRQTTLALIIRSSSLQYSNVPQR